MHHQHDEVQLQNHKLFYGLRCLPQQTAIDHSALQLNVGQDLKTQMLVLLANIVQFHV